MYAYALAAQVVWWWGCASVCFYTHFPPRQDSGHDKCVTGFRHLQLSEKLSFRVNAHARRAARTPVILTRCKVRCGWGEQARWLTHVLALAYPLRFVQCAVLAKCVCFSRNCLRGCRKLCVDLYDALKEAAALASASQAGGRSKLQWIGNFLFVANVHFVHF